MLGTMLVGAWLLIQQQCCSVYGDSASRFRSAALVDPLMRRSPLEKNFMRFGRSSPSTFLRESRLKENFMRFGRPVLDPTVTLNDFPSVKNIEPFLKRNEELSETGEEKLSDISKDSASRMRRAKENFMRFGRDKENDKSDEEKIKRQGNFMRFGRNKDESKGSLDIPLDLPSSFFFQDGDFLRNIRAKENFMRFGRDKERVLRNEKGKQDGFIRFGKSESSGEGDYDNCDDAVDRRITRGGDTGFVRFGRGNEKFMRFGKKSTDGESSRPIEKDKTLLIRVARDEDGIVRSARQKQQDNSNGFIRFGRNDRQKRDTHKHKQLSHHLNSISRNAQQESDPGVCKSSFVDDKTLNEKDVECKDGSCKPLYLPWPFYYQPSLYSVLPNILTTPQVSMLPSPQYIHKPKRSRANLQSFIRLG